MTQTINHIEKLDFDFESMDIPYRTMKQWKRKEIIKNNKILVSVRRSKVMKKAWKIRKESAKKFGCKVSEINFGECMKEAWRVV